MKKSTISLAFAATATAMAASNSMAEVSANIGATSDYLWRGVSQSNQAASISGGIDYAAESGFYAGTWVGSLGDSQSGFNGSEVDLYFGYGAEINDTFSYDLGYIYYHYPKIDDGNFGEVYGSVGISMFELGFAYTVNSDVDDTSIGAESFVEGDLYIHAGVSFDLAEDWSLGLTVGSYMFDNDGDFGADFDYVHYQADFGKSTDYGDFTFTVSATDIDDDDESIVVSWSKGF